jgi:small subunit ribosomal protein S17
METCNDFHCPEHGELAARGREFTGTVIEARAQKTATVQWQRRHYITKYERYERRRSTKQAHNPPCIDAKKGDIVRISECRPISKTKKFVIIEKLGRDIAYLAREELLEAAKQHEPAKAAEVKHEAKVEHKHVKEAAA